MPKEKIKKHHEPGEHIWEFMKEYEIKDINLENWTEKGIKEKVKILERINPNQYVILATLPSREINTQPFLNYINKLREQGLDIDKSDDARYGYKMPPAEKGKRVRELRIFRREARKEKIFRRK